MKTWLWPDRTIGKRESGTLREEHNATVNQCADLCAALEACAFALEGATTMLDPAKVSTAHVNGFAAALLNAGAALDKARSVK
jgi:hypothetical protein